MQFTFEKTGEQNGKITYGDLTIRVCNRSGAYNNSDMSRSDAANLLKQMADGLTGEVELNIADGTCAVELCSNTDTFTVTLGCAMDMLYAADLKCKFSENKTEIVNLLNFMHEGLTKE